MGLAIWKISGCSMLPWKHTHVELYFFVSEVLYLSGVKPRWVKRKRQLSRVESMLAAKSQRAASGESSSVTNHLRSNLALSLLGNRVLWKNHSSDEETDSDTESDFNETSSKEVYRDWMSSQCKSDVKMMAVVLMDTFCGRFGMTDDEIV